MMFYQKNLPVWERVIRVMMGIAMAMVGWVGLHGGMLGYGLVAMGVMAALTGFVGFCPACALVGRKLKAK
jgi:hypothetical protein